MNKELEQIKERCEKVLDEQFPKGKCKERGNALVLFAQMYLEIERFFPKENKTPGFEFPLEVYLNDNFRENYFKSQNWVKKPKELVILNDASDLSPADMFKLKKMLNDIERRKMTAQEFLDLS